MVFIVEAFFSGCISKIINDGKDYSWAKIKREINDRNNRNLSTKIYRVIENTLNIVTDKKFQGQDILYEAIEKIFIGFRDHGSTIESVKCGLDMLSLDAAVERCENFLEKFYDGICQDEELYRRISLILQEKGIDINQKEFQQLNNVVEYGFDQLNRKVDKIDEKIIINNNEDILQNKGPVKSRTQEYADKWNQNMFLNDFDKRDENAGVNVKLSDVYLSNHLPHYIWGKNNSLRLDLEDLLSEYIYENNNRILLIFGKPGIGKSTLITWITTHFEERIDDIFVYQFADDLENVNWQKNDSFEEILNILNMSYVDLDGKVLILDGFDEINVGDIRENILNNLHKYIIFNKYIKNFVLIITCREYYVQRLEKLKSSYITLQPWDEAQIDSFYKIFQIKVGDIVCKDKLEKMFEFKEILGIPLITYMVISLKITIDKEGSVVDVYDKIFALDGGIYDRCIDNKSFGKDHRISKLDIKKYIHQISKEIAFWMFENNANEEYIPQECYIKICDTVMKEQNQEEQEIKSDFKIGNFFKLVRHCEGAENEKLYFVHRTIYEYFVTEVIYSSIESDMLKLTEESQEYLAKNIAFYLKEGVISPTIGEYLQHKIIKFYYKLNTEKKQKFYQWWETTVGKMMEVGMFYYTKRNICAYKSIILEEYRCFINLIEILRLLLKLSNEKVIMSRVKKELIESYVKYCITIDDWRAGKRYKNIDLSRVTLNGINLNGMNLKNINFSGAYLEEADLSECNLYHLKFQDAVLKKADLRGSDLVGADLRQADLREVKLWGADLERSILIGADLRGAKLWGANLLKADLLGADLRGAIVDEYQVSYLEDICDLQESQVFIYNSVEIISYEDYCRKRIDFK